MPSAPRLRLLNARMRTEYGCLRKNATAIYMSGNERNWKPLLAISSWATSLSKSPRDTDLADYHEPLDTRLKTTDPNLKESL